MAQTFSALFKDGQEYLHIWPVKKELYTLFPECRIVSATKLSIKTMPPLAVLTIATSFSVLGMEHLPQAIAMAAFFLTIPAQGVLWLGYRANQFLPPSTNTWYQNIHHKMQLQGCALQGAKARPKYKELATLLKTAFDELDKVFTKQWF
ncbi:MAG: uncharacterized membrane protein YfbV (UPF0208 family) [Paraglaciecola sp.]|jgi:uncharacterized membrane protein YfbV (UPF0208 family)